MLPEVRARGRLGGRLLRRGGRVGRSDRDLTLFLILASSIGLEFRVAPLREAGWRPRGHRANLLVGLPPRLSHD